MERLSSTEENYLKAIYFLGRPNNQRVSTNAIADRLETRAATVTDMLRRLKEKELVEYRPYKGTLLSTAGQKVATAVLRKHRLWETFLVEKLEFGWDEVHEVAEQLEHVHSPKLTERLAAFLNFPDYDPHGDPIPNAAGQFPQRASLTLAQAREGQELVIKGVKDTSAEFLRYVQKMGLGLGQTVKVIGVEAFDHSLTLLLDERELTLSPLATANIYVTEL